MEQQRYYSFYVNSNSVLSFLSRNQSQVIKGTFWEIGYICSSKSLLFTQHLSCLVLYKNYNNLITINGFVFRYSKIGLSALKARKFHRLRKQTKLRIRKIFLMNEHFIMRIQNYYKKQYQKVPKMYSKTFLILHTVLTRVKRAFVQFGLLSFRLAIQHTIRTSQHNRHSEIKISNL